MSISTAQLNEVQRHARELHIRPFRDNYIILLGQQQRRDVADMQAREDWKNYYRSVRILRRLRNQDMKRFLQFGTLWYRTSMKAEYDMNEMNRGEAVRFLREKRIKDFPTRRQLMTNFFPEGETT